MQLISFKKAGAVHVGVLGNGGNDVFDLTEAGIAGNMLDLIEAFDSKRNAIEALANGTGVALASVELMAPIPVPRRNIFCVGKNYHEHAMEFGNSGFDAGSIGGNEVPDAPIVFTKPPSSVIGPNEGIRSDLDPYGSVDYEGELAVVIGRRGRVAEGDDPLSFVFGYSVFNDVTSRELQKRHKQWVLGKGIDTFGPMGPSITTKDAVPDVSSLRLELWVNEEKRQSALLGDLIFDIPTLVKTIGRSITLEPGDIIATGTPVGVGIGFKPPRYLKAGDLVRVEISTLGSLVNPIV